MVKAPIDNYTIQHKMRATKAMLFLLNRSQELNRLIAWATEKEQSRQAKKYFFIQKSYQEQRQDTLGKLIFLRVRFPAQYWLARILHSISHLSASNPAYYAGSAADYSRREKTRKGNHTIGKKVNRIDTSHKSMQKTAGDCENILIIRGSRAERRAFKKKSQGKGTPLSIANLHDMPQSYDPHAWCKKRFNLPDNLKAEVDDEDDELTYHFWTAAVPPEKWLQEVSRIFPNLRFSNVYDGPNDDRGTIHVRNGELVEHARSAAYAQ